MKHISPPTKIGRTKILPLTPAVRAKHAKTSSRARLLAPATRSR